MLPFVNAWNDLASLNWPTFFLNLYFGFHCCETKQASAYCTIGKSNALPVYLCDMQRQVMCDTNVTHEWEITITACILLWEIIFFISFVKLHFVVCVFIVSHTTLGPPWSRVCKPRCGVTIGMELFCLLFNITEWKCIYFFGK